MLRNMLTTCYGGLCQRKKKWKLGSSSEYFFPALATVHLRFGEREGGAPAHPRTVTARGIETRAL